MKHYDAIIVGAGQAGPPLAAALAEQKQRVALIEGNLLGGSCVNYGCTPTKTLRKSARVAWLARRAADFGVTTGPVSVDFAAVMARVQRVVAASRGGLAGWMAAYPDHIDVVEAWGQFAGRDGENFVIQAGSAALRAPQVFLNTGTRAAAPPIEGLADVPYLDNIGLLALDALPEHLLILGGGYIGIEMAQIFRRLGSDVTLVEGGPRLAGREDADVCAAIEELLAAEGIRILTSHQAARVAHDSAGIHLTLQPQQGTPVTVSGSHLLVAIGRIPNTDRLNLGAVGVATDARGYIPTDNQYRTNVPGIYALGDVNGRGAFTHTSYQDHEIMLDILAGGPRRADERTMAYAMYTDPPMGRVGWGEREARASGRRVLMAVHEMKNVSRAKEESETHGLIKLLVDAETEQFVGACVFGIGGDEIIQVISNFMAAGGSYRAMKDALPIHPTVTEFFPTILGKLAPLA